MLRPLLLMLALAACGPGRAFLKEGRTAAAAQDWPKAYRAYDHVLERKPHHAEALAGRREAQERVLGALDAVLERELRAGRLDRVRAAIDEAARVDAPRSWRDAWNQRWQEAWVGRLEAEASAAEGRGSVGEAWVLRTAIASFAEGAASRADAVRAWERLRASQWSGVRVGGAGPGADAVLQRVASAWARSPWAEVPMGRTLPGGWTVELQASDHACRVDTVGTRQAVHRYTDGTMVANPRIAALRAELDDARRSSQAAEADRARLQIAEDRGFDRLQRAARDVERLLPAVNGAEQQLADAARARRQAQRAVKRAEQASAAIVQLEDAARVRQGKRRQLRSRLQALQVEQAAAEQRLAAVEARLAERQDALAVERRVRRQARAELTRATQEHEQAGDRLEKLREKLEAAGLEPPAPGQVEDLEELQEQVEEARAARDALAQRQDRLLQRQAAAKEAGDAEALAEVEQRLLRVQARLEDAQSELDAVKARVLEARFVQARRARRRTGRDVQAAATLAEQAQVRFQATREVKEQVQEEREARAAELQALGTEREEVEGGLAALAEAARVDRVERQGLEPVAREVEPRRQAFRRSAAAWRAADAARATVLAELDRLEARRAEAEQDHASVRAARLEAASIADDWARRQDEIRRDLDAEPARIELVKEASYTVTRRRRTCRLTGSLLVTSPRAGTREVPLRLEQVDEDDTHQARARIRLEADPETFASTDAAALDGLVQGASRVTSTALAEQAAAEAASLRRAAGRTRELRTRQLALADLLDPTPDLGVFLDQRFDLPDGVQVQRARSGSNR